MPHPVRDFRRRRRIDIRPDYLLADNAVGETIPRYSAIGSTGAPTSGTLYLNAVGLRAGRRVTNISYCSGSTALTHGSGANSAWYFALYNASRVLLGQSANQGQAAWGSNTIMTLALQTPVVIPVDGQYYVGLMIYAGTGGSPATPGLLYHQPATIINASAPIQAATSSTALTSGTAPNPAGALTAALYHFWAKLT